MCVKYINLLYIGKVLVWYNFFFLLSFFSVSIKGNLQLQFPVIYVGNGHIGHCNQGNNMYLFPGLVDSFILYFIV